MSDLELESEFDPKTRSTRFGCVVPDKSFLVDPRSIVDDVRHALGQTILKTTVERIIPRVKQSIEDALAEEFGGRKKSEERKAGEGIERAGGKADAKADEVFSLWRIDVLTTGSTREKKCSYAWVRSADEAQRLFRTYYKQELIDKIEQVFSGDIRHFLTLLDSDGTIRPLSVTILPPPE